MGEKWKGLTDKQKAPYEAKAAADKKRYEEEKAAYTAVSSNRSSLSLTCLTDNLRSRASPTMRRVRIKCFCSDGLQPHTTSTGVQFAEYVMACVFYFAWPGVNWDDDIQGAMQRAI